MVHYLKAGLMFDIIAKWKGNNFMRTFTAMSIVVVLEPILRIFVYIAFIFLCYKAIEALNVYINKNKR